MTGTNPAAAFACELRFADLPPEVVERARWCLLDLLGVAAAGARTPMARIALEHAAAEMPAGARWAELWFDGRLSSPAGAAFANAAVLDSFDGHDGHALTKGHAGAAVLPAVLASTGARSGRELITALVVGYEIATRAGIALHAATSEYHASGGWNALGCAAVAARSLGIGPEESGHALGIAEYHAPRSPMMRCVDRPAMVKDGSAWGAHAGVHAAVLAARGFTGAPAGLVEHAELWGDLGVRWRIREQYFKPHPVCRWAHPAIEAVLGPMRAADVGCREIARIDVRTFAAAARLAAREPASTEQAQYSLPFAVAAAAVHGRVGAELLAAPSGAGAELRRLSRSLRVQVAPEFERVFPEQRWAEATLVLRDGRSLRSGAVSAPGGPESPMTGREITGKFRNLAAPVLGRERAERIATLSGEMGRLPDVPERYDALLAEITGPL
ncbi:MmgE/PrpD family protein [Salinifilum aidingensis]